MALPRLDLGSEKLNAGGIPAVLSVPASTKQFTWITALFPQPLYPSSGQPSLVVKRILL